jgi:hypothetical protein
LSSEVERMIWLRRKFAGVEYVEYRDRLEALMMAMPDRYAEFLMVSVKTDQPLVDEYFVGLPTIQLLDVFDGFADVAEADLPKDIDTFHLGDQTKPPFTSRFKFRER